MSNVVDTAENIPYEKLYYIKLIPGEKNPLETWGGYTHDPEEAVESDDPDINVYTHDQVLEDEHEHWGIVGISGPGRSLLFYDLDIYKAPDFDADRIKIDGSESVPVVKSPSGGLHAWTCVYEERGGGKESDFDVDDDLPFDIDIRGSFVSMHTVAPNAIPGVGGEYELTNDVKLMTHSDVRDSVNVLKWRETDEPIITYNVNSGVGDFDFERSAEAPDDMPTCYHAGLQLRSASPDDHPNTFKVNTLTAMCGIAAGYGVEDVVKHFCDDFPPDDPDERLTRQHVERLYRKFERGDMLPPAISTLREWGILNDDETCTCPIDYHGRSGSGRHLTDGGTVEDDEERPTTEAGIVAPSNFVVNDGGYGVQVEKTDEEGDVYYVWDEWTNFEIELQSIVTTPDGDKEMALTVHPRNEDTYEVSVDPTVLNETRSFKKEVCTGATTTFDGKPSDLTKIKQYVGSQEAPRKLGTNHMGYHTKGDGAVWVTPDGNLDADGWVDETEIAYLKKDITAERKWDLSPDDGAEYDAEAVREILELLPQVRERARIIPLIGWFYASAVRPLIMDWEGQFNFVSVTGETGAGKTTTIETLWRLFGMEGEPLTPKTTEASLLTTFSTSQSVPMWYDEYKPSDLSKQEVDRFHEKLRMSTRGQVDQRSNVDMSDTTYRLQAPIVVSGEERIQGSAEERRGIFTSFKYATRKPGTSTALANAKLNGRSTTDPTDFTKSVVFDGYDFTNHALAYIRWVCGLDQDMLKDKWHDADEWARDEVGSKGVAGLDDLELQGLQTIRFGTELFRAFHRAVGGDGEVVTDAEVKDAFTFITSGGGGREDRQTHLNVMLDVASRAASEGYLEEDAHYTFVHKNKSNEELRINLNTAFDKVKRYAKDHDVSGDLLNNKSDYDERLRNEEDALDWLTCRGRQTRPVGSAIGIDTDVAEAQIDGFGRWMWDSEVEGSTEEEWKPLDNSAEGRVNLTFEVIHQDTDHDGKMAESGTIADSTKSVDYVIWESERDKVPQMEEGKCYSARGVSKGRYDGKPQYEFDAGVRDITEVEKGFGHIEAADAGMNTSLDAAAATDGGEIDQLAGKVYEAVEQHGPISEARLSGLLVGANPEYDFGDVQGAIKTARSRGRIEDLGAGLETI